MNSEPDPLLRRAWRASGFGLRLAELATDHLASDEAWANAVALPTSELRLGDLSVGGDRFTSWRTLEQVEREVGRARRGRWY